MEVVKISRTPDDISASVRAKLSSTIPGLSCELGTPERKIIDACSEAISEAYIAQYLIGGMLDMDTKSGLELEQMVGIFGFGRLLGKAAKGVVRVTSNVALTQDQLFPLGTQFYTKPGISGLSSTLYFSSTQATVLVAGTLSCDIPVKCTTVGSNGNVPPDSVTYVGQVIGGATCTNLTAMTGGVDTETDQELRQRVKDTLLRNVSGTADWYKAVCQQNNSVTRVTVFGPLSTYRTQIAVPDTELVLPVTQDVKYAWDQMSSMFTNLGQEDEIFYSDVDDYVFTSGTSPTVTRVGSGELVVDDVVDLEFQYTTRSSRNDPLNDITNKIDVFVDGVDPSTTTEKTVVSATELSASSASVYYTGNFRRVGTAGSPTSGNRFMRLGSTPVISFPATITTGGVTYTLGTHYHLLADTTLMSGTHHEVSGIEWTAAGPATNTELTLNYVYNRVPELLNTVIAGSKQICTDVLVHVGSFAYLRPCLSVEYDSHYSVSLVNSQIATRLQSYFSSLPFGAPVKVSNLCMAVQQVLGVVDVKLTTSGDDPDNYGVEIYDSSADPDPSVVETGDFRLLDNQLAMYQGMAIRRVAAP